MNRSAALLTAVLALSGIAGAATPPDALVQEGTTVKLAPHTWVIPDDADVPLVPVVGIVVGTKGTLVIDPGLGKRNGEAVRREVAKISRNTQVYLASTHFHPEHTLGILGFPDSAKYINSVTQEAEAGESAARMIGLFAARSPLTAELLQGAAAPRAAITLTRNTHSTSAASACASSSWVPRTRAATRFSSSKATRCCSRAMSS